MMYMMVHTFNPVFRRISEFKAGLMVYIVLGQPGLHKDRSIDKQFLFIWAVGCQNTTTFAQGLKGWTTGFLGYTIPSSCLHDQALT